MVAGALIAGFVSGFAGFGTGMVASGFWFAAMPSSAVPPLIILTSIIAQVMGMYRLRHSIDWANARPYLVGGIVGVTLGVMALQVAPPHWVRITVGTFLVLYAGVQISGLRNLSIGEFGGKPADTIVGGTSGFFGGFAGLPGPVSLVWLQLRGGPASSQRMIYQPLNLVTVCLACIGMTLGGQMTTLVLGAAALCIPATIIGAIIGLRMYSDTGEPLFRKIVLILLLISGSILLYQSLGWPLAI